MADMECPLLPEPGRHVVDDEYVDTQACSDKQEHSDHYWSTEGHEHDGFGYVCMRYCEGLD